MSTPSIVALIPARAGSKRCAGKNMRRLGGRILMDWTIAAALDSGIFADVCVVTDIDSLAHDDERVIFFARSPSTAVDDAPDILWVREFFEHNQGGDAFAILRPTSPFRTAETIKRAWAEFLASQPCDSLRAVQPVKEHPGKMWKIANDGAIRPLLPEVRCQVTRDFTIGHTTPYHSLPTQTLPPVYVQNASLEIAWTRVVTETGTISGTRIMPFFTHGHEGFDINTEADWAEAERLVTRQPLEYLG